MAKNYGKSFEIKFKECWKKSFPNSFLYRLPDQMSGYAGGYSANPCDFFAFTDKKLFLLEVKSHYGNTFPLSNLRQYEKLVSYEMIPDVYPGVILWMIDHDKVIYIPLKEITKMMNDGKKSINIKMLADKSYKIIEIPSVKKRVFLDSDYSNLINQLTTEDDA